jgi:hypothetical protein
MVDSEGLCVSSNTEGILNSICASAVGTDEESGTAGRLYGSQSASL